MTEPTGGPLRVLFLARSLGMGGAERQLAELARGLARRGHQVSIATFYAQNIYREALECSDVRLLAMGKRGRWHSISFVRRLARLIACLQPHIVYSFLPVPNILAVWPRLTQAGHRLVWGVRASELPPERYDMLTRLALRVEARLARFPDLVIANSTAGRRDAAQRGFPADRLAVVPNGIDIEHFRPPTAEERSAARAAFGIPQDRIAIGLVARLDPMKNHAGFLRSVALAAAQRDVHALIAGAEPGVERTRLQALAASLGITERSTWAGSVLDIRRVYAALDVLCIASTYGEGFPNVLGEAMACGLACAATDVGDAARILGDLGPVVAPGDEVALADALLQAAERARSDGSLSARLRARVVDGYSIDSMVTTTERMFLDLRGSAEP